MVLWRGHWLKIQSPNFLMTVLCFQIPSFSVHSLSFLHFKKKFPDRIRKPIVWPSLLTISADLGLVHGTPSASVYLLGSAPQFVAVLFDLADLLLFFLRTGSRDGAYVTWRIRFLQNFICNGWGVGNPFLAWKASATTLAKAFFLILCAVMCASVMTTGHNWSSFQLSLQWSTAERMCCEKCKGADVRTYRLQTDVWCRIPVSSESCGKFQTLQYQLKQVQLSYLNEF